MKPWVFVTITSLIFDRLVFTHCKLVLYWTRRLWWRHNHVFRSHW